MPASGDDAGQREAVAVGDQVQMLGAGLLGDVPEHCVVRHESDDVLHGQSLFIISSRRAPQPRVFAAQCLSALVMHMRLPRMAASLMACS